MKKIIKILVASLVILIFAFAFLNNRKDAMVGEVIETEEVGLVTYENVEYGFALDFPSDWHVFEDFSGGSPIINIYKKVPGKNPPFIHFDVVPHFSIYPNGVPTEGIVGGTEDVTETQQYTDEGVARVLDFKLVDGDSWATLVTFSDVPDNWKEWGFVWLGGKVYGYEEKCFRGNEEVSVYDCNVFMGDEIRRVGEIDEKIRGEELEVLKSFRFLK